MFYLIVAGFSPYVMLFIRSAKQPPINEFSPNNLAKIKPYMNRESYPSRPLIFGPYFDAQIKDVSTKALSYVKQEDQYEAVGEVPEYQYDENRSTVLPRIYSNDPAHVKVYQSWSGLANGEKPRFIHNLKFMIKYQLGHMYWRYLMWNFSGRAGDEQHADALKPWELPADRTSLEYNRAYNQYFLLPFLIGVFGFWFQAKKDRKLFAANLAFFLITGLFLTIYLNGTPNEPRERDYIYVGSYTAFSIWVGLGMIGLMNLLGQMKWRLVLGSTLILVPVWMLYQNWDDHDRSGRTLQIDHARNMLGSCDEGAILFTGGDNDTFPLWYLQEVEGFRTDVRVKVLSYFNADWYINDLTRDYYESPPVKLSLQNGANQYGPYDPVYIRETTQSPISWSKFVAALKARNPQLVLRKGEVTDYFYLPSRQVRLATDIGTLDLKIDGSYLPKSDMAILDLIQSNGWERPIYFNFTSLNSISVNLRNYVVDEGWLYRLTPDSNNGQMDYDLEKAYSNLVEASDYSNLSDELVYFNHEDFELRVINPIKMSFTTLIGTCLESGEEEMAEKVINFARENIFLDHLKPSYADLQLGVLLQRMGKKEDAKLYFQNTFDYLFAKVELKMGRGKSPARNDLLILQEASRLLNDREVKERLRVLINGRS
jgi:hypothetical protein